MIGLNCPDCGAEGPTCPGTVRPVVGCQWWAARPGAEEVVTREDAMDDPTVTVRIDDLRLFFELVIENGMLDTPEECEAADRVHSVLERDLARTGQVGPDSLVPWNPGRGVSYEKACHDEIVRLRDHADRLLVALSEIENTSAWPANEIARAALRD